MPVGGHYDALPEEYWVKLTDYFASRETAKTENETDLTVEE